MLVAASLAGFVEKWVLTTGHENMFNKFFSHLKDSIGKIIKMLESQVNVLLSCCPSIACTII